MRSLGMESVNIQMFKEQSKGNAMDWTNVIFKYPMIFLEDVALLNKNC